MPLSQTAEGAQRRYAAVLYHTALLRDPDPQRAGRAVAAAFRATSWDDVALNDQTEARLVANLPALPRIQLFRAARFTGLPVAFWKLPAPTRLALGLRLLRGMPMVQIALALHLSLAQTQTRIIDGIRAVSGATAPFPETCCQCWIARLDDPTAGRVHLLTCSACRASLPTLKQMELNLAEQLDHAVGHLPLPAAIDAELAMQMPGEPRRFWQRPAVVQSVLVGIILLGLCTLFWRPRSAMIMSSAPGTLAPVEMINAVRAMYTSVPPAGGILHRQWAITLRQPQLTLQADEWVDPQQPARHRMQLIADRRTVEWQMGNGQDDLTYMSSLAPAFCGSSPNGVTSHGNEQNHWSMDPRQQEEMRTARWEHGAWAIGLHYLNLAATADTIRSLGVSGNGPDTTLTVTAAGHTISGTLVLRLDPLHHVLREVHELQSNHGQTDDRVPWRLLNMETIAEQAALDHGLLTAYPDDHPPRLVERRWPLVDRGCPLVGSEQAHSLPRLLTTPSVEALIGLPQLPPGLDHALIIGPDNPTTGDFTHLQSVYVGPTKRLVLFSELPAPVRNDLVAAGPWRVHFLPQELPTVISATLQPVTVPSEPALAGPSTASFMHVVAEGWTRDELVAALATVRPLQIDDWLQTPDRFYEPLPLPPALLAHAQALFSAARLRPGKIHHEVTLETTRQAPFFATLPDPYHASPDSWPAVRRRETWVEYSLDGSEHRALSMLRDIAGHVLIASGHDEQSEFRYDALSSSAISEPSQHVMQEPAPEAAVFAGTLNWHWATKSDGSLQAEQSQNLLDDPTWLSGDRPGQRLIDDWTTDLTATTGVARKTFDDQGNLRREEILVNAGVTIGRASSNVNLPIASIPISITIRSRVVEHNEWLSHVADGTFDWSPPAGTREASRDALEKLHSRGIEQVGSVQSLAEAAGDLSFPVWGWFPQWSPPDATPRFRSAALLVPTLEIARPNLQVPSNDAVGFGMATELSYDLGDRSLRILEGPAPDLRHVLQQTIPAWSAAERRTIVIQGQAQDVWVMRGLPATKNESHRWVVFEWRGTLFFMQTVAPDADLEMLLTHLGEFRQLTPAKQP